MESVNAVGDLFRLSGRVAVVTGAAEGLGRAIAIGLASAGADIVAVDIDLDRMSETLAGIRAAGTRAHPVKCDVSAESDVDHLFSEVDREFGRVDILINNAGVNSVSSEAETYPADGWDETLRINLTGSFLCARAAGQRMLAQDHGGSIVNISSIAGSSAANRGSLAFGAAKAGVNQLTRDLAVEWAPKGIRVNAIQPCQFRSRGWATTIEDPRNEHLVSTVVHGIPMGRLGEPEEMVGPVLFLASDAASMVTGVILPVDGGNLAMNAGAGGVWPHRRKPD
jgi:NAD(P)-dependent dehydrogenase (short-subunit alcohol dehydrogenase family)